MDYELKLEIGKGQGDGCGREGYGHLGITGGTARSSRSPLALTFAWGSGAVVVQVFIVETLVEVLLSNPTHSSVIHTSFATPPGY